MKIEYNIVTRVSMVILMMSVALARGQDTNDEPISVANRPMSTNQTIRLKGPLSQTRVLTMDQPTLEKIKSAQAKLKISGSSRGTTGGPKNLKEAGEYLLSHVALAAPPEVCAEYQGTFYFAFSGAAATDRATNLVSGLAIKIGDPNIYSWSSDRGYTKERKR